ncbi:MAG: zf-HC2 domain-containing protein [Myxococcales bacterium]|nr:zf-HC2 domain-containing protein [Myxococcales bacterium]
MRCEECRQFIGAYVDGEFDDVSAVEFERHLAFCDACSAHVEREAGFKAFLKESIRPTAAPKDLQKKIRASIKREHPIGVPVGGQALFAIASVFLLAFAVPALLHEPAPPEEGPLAASDELVEASLDWHQRNLPIEVTGPDSDTVSNWFSNKVDFPVRLPQFNEDHRAHVLGGRLAHFNNSDAAYVLYEVGGRKMTLAVIPREGLVPRRLPTHSVLIESRAGLNVAVFESDGITYAVTSDLPRETVSNMVTTARFEP